MCKGSPYYSCHNKRNHFRIFHSSKSTLEWYSDLLSFPLSMEGMTMRDNFRLFRKNFFIGRLTFPLVNTLVFGALGALFGYYMIEMLYWLLAGGIAGLVIGLAVEFGLGTFGGWIYRHRVLLTASLEITLCITILAPFLYFYPNTLPNRHTVCCKENSGLGDRVEEVRIPVADHETLAGWYVPPEKENDAVILVLHGSGGDRKSSLVHAKVLHDAGFGVLVYDQRAMGESSGNRASTGVYDKRDITPIIDWLIAKKHATPDRIGGVGLSLGAHILIGAAPYEPRLKAIWSDGLGINTIADLPPQVSDGEKFMTFIEGQTNWISELYLGEKLVQIKQLLPRIMPRPVMLVAGGLEPYETQFNREYASLVGKNENLWIIENTGHMGGLSAQPEVYSQRMVDFFKENLY